jgi:hypothetical protein
MMVFDSWDLANQNGHSTGLKPMIFMGKLQE